MSSPYQVGTLTWYARNSRRPIDVVIPNGCLAVRALKVLLSQSC